MRRAAVVWVGEETSCWEWTERRSCWLLAGWAGFEPGWAREGGRDADADKGRRHHSLCFVRGGHGWAGGRVEGRWACREYRGVFYVLTSKASIDASSRLHSTRHTLQDQLLKRTLRSPPSTPRRTRPSRIHFPLVLLLSFVRAYRRRTPTPSDALHRRRPAHQPLRRPSLCRTCVALTVAQPTISRHTQLPRPRWGAPRKDIARISAHFLSGMGWPSEIRQDVCRRRLPHLRGRVPSRERCARTPPRIRVRPTAAAAAAAAARGALSLRRAAVACWRVEASERASEAKAIVGFSCIFVVWDW